MEKFTVFTGLAAPLDRAHVDTDQLIPKQFLKRVEREGFGQYLFHNWRFRPDGAPEPGFVLNQPRYQGASVLLAGDNFGSGSSREHAPWALLDYGFRAVIAPSFADIFKNNSFKTGLLLIELDGQMLGEWFKRVEANEGYRITVDLGRQELLGSDGFACVFAIDPFHKRRLLLGLDDIGLTLEQHQAIQAYERTHNEPWRAGRPGASQEARE